MNFKEHAHSRIIADLNALNKQLGKARNEFLAKKAEKDSFESRLIKAAEGSSTAEKTVNAKCTQDWLDFHKALARKEAIFEFLKFQFRILECEYQSQYQETKLDQRLIDKHSSNE